MENGARYPSLRDEVVFVTGGASGIGRSLVEHFHDRSGRVVFADLSEQAGRDLAAALGAKEGHEPYFEACDLRDVGRLRADIACMASWPAADDGRMCSKQTFVADAGWL